MIESQYSKSLTFFKPENIDPKYLGFVGVFLDGDIHRTAFRMAHVFRIPSNIKADAELVQHGENLIVEFPKMRVQECIEVTPETLPILYSNWLKCTTEYLKNYNRPEKQFAKISMRNGNVMIGEVLEEVSSYIMQENIYFMTNTVEFDSKISGISYISQSPPYLSICWAKSRDVELLLEEFDDDDIESYHETLEAKEPIPISENLSLH